MDSISGSSDSLNNWHEHVVDPMTRATAQGRSSKLRTAWVSTEMEGAASDEELIEDAALNRGRGRFTLDTPGVPSPPKRASPPFPAQEIMSSSPPRMADLPPGFVPTGGYVPTDGSATFGSPKSPYVVPPPPPPVPHPVPAFPSPVSHSIPPLLPTDVPPFPPPREVELSPKLIAKAQKHCKYAISALDYEDTQHAIRELRAALETLGASV